MIRVSVSLKVGYLMNSARRQPILIRDTKEGSQGFDAKFSFATALPSKGKLDWPSDIAQESKVKTMLRPAERAIPGYG